MTPYTSFSKYKKHNEYVYIYISTTIVFLVCEINM
jgi:hypothetical protein